MGCNASKPAAVEAPAAAAADAAPDLGPMAKTKGSIVTYPKKQRDLHSHHFDSTMWDDFKFRDDDIIIATYAKSGKYTAFGCDICVDMRLVKTSTSRMHRGCDNCVDM